MNAKVRKSVVKMRVIKIATCPDKIAGVNYTKDCFLVVVISTRNTWPVRESEGIDGISKLRIVSSQYRG